MAASKPHLHVFCGEDWTGSAFVLSVGSAEEVEIGLPEASLNFTGRGFDGLIKSAALASPSPRTFFVQDVPMTSV
jgi:hypothetical protein